MPPARAKPTAPLAARLAAIAAALLLAGAPARAETTQAQAASLESQIRAFITRQLGPVLDAASIAFKATPAGDGINLELPIGGPMLRGLVEAAQGALSIRVKPLDDNRYAIEDAHVTSPLRFTFPGDKPRTTTFRFDEQNVTGVLDTSLATTSSLDSKFRGYGVTVDGPNGLQTTRVDRLTGHATWLPKGGARVDVTGNGEGEKYTLANRLPDGAVVDVAADRLIGTARMENFDFDRLGALVQAAASLGASFNGRDPGQDKPTPAQRALLRTALTSFAELMDTLSSDQSMQNLRVTAGGQTGTLKRLSIGLAAAAPDGLMQLRLPIALEGLDSPLIPQGAMRDLLPRLVSLVPRLGGVPKADLLAILLRALDSDTPDTDAMQAEALQMLAAHPISMGVEKLAIELGLASLHGGGEVKISGPSEVAGDGEFRMTGLDALIRRANTAPELKMAAPALIFLKGIGRADGKDMVWHISYDDRVLMVNDTNMTEMMPGK